MLVYAAMNLGMVTILFFILGMIKPQWPLFFAEKPNRFIIVMISVVMLMVSFTMYGEGVKRKSTPKEWAKVEASASDKLAAGVRPLAPVPVPEIKDSHAVPVPVTPEAKAITSAPTLEKK